MPHSMVKLWVHAVWGTKNWQSLIQEEFRLPILQHIRNAFEEQGCIVRSLQGIANHLHALFLLPPEKQLANIMKMVKGESSHWINQQNFLRVKFAWQVGYGAFSVSESMVEKVDAYIRNQEKHHRKMTFQEEYEQFLVRYGLSGNR